MEEPSRVEVWHSPREIATQAAQGEFAVPSPWMLFGVDGGKRFFREKHHIPSKFTVLPPSDVALQSLHGSGCSGAETDSQRSFTTGELSDFISKEEHHIAELHQLRLRQAVSTIPEFKLHTEECKYKTPFSRRHLPSPVERHPKASPSCVRPPYIASLKAPSQRIVEFQALMKMEVPLSGANTAAIATSAGGPVAPRPPARQTAAASQVTAPVVELPLISRKVAPNAPATPSFVTSTVTWKQHLVAVQSAILEERLKRKACEEEIEILRSEKTVPLSM